MIKKISVTSLFIFILSCGNFELVLDEFSSPNPLKNNVLIISSGEEKDRFVQELYSLFGSNKKDSYILVTSIVETKENRVVKNNQVAEKIDYELNIDYKLFYKNRECKILERNIITRFTASPKSFGYNFGADRSFEKEYNSNIKKNILSFIAYVPDSKKCRK